MTEPESSIQAVLDRLHADAERLFGTSEVRLSVVHAAERETSKVLKIAVNGCGAVDVFFVKIFKSREDGAQGRERMRARVLHDFDVSSRVHASLSGTPRHAVARPLACFPDHLAVVTAEAKGDTLSELLESRAAWWPSSATIDELGSMLSGVGGWLRVFQASEPCIGRFSLGTMRDYIDVRLRRLLVTSPPALDSDCRKRVLEYFDRTASRVAADDLREVWTHADLAPSNVLMDGDRVTVIDFAMAATGGLYMDVARLYTQLEFLLAKPKFRPAVVRALQRRLLEGFDPGLRPDRPLFQLFVLQHLLCHMSNLARNPAPALARLYNRHQLRLRRRWLQTFAA